MCSTGTLEGDSVARAVASFWEQVGEAQPVTIDAAAHDAQLAWTSHLPQAVASALAVALGARALGGVSFGPGGRDTTRLAASDPDLWAEIFLANAGPVTEALAQAGDALQQLRALIAARRRERAQGLPGAGRRVPEGPRSMKVHGSVRVPGDKSITHRALLFGALARGRSHIGGALTSLDARSSARVLRQLGRRDLRAPRRKRHRDRRAGAACGGPRTCSTAAIRAPRRDSCLACWRDTASPPR